jgi:hypothetical protein
VEVILFTIVGIALYLVTVALLAALENLHGDPLPQRNIVFFVIFLALSLPAFSGMRALLGGDEGAQHDNEEQQAADRGHQSTETH